MNIRIVALAEFGTFIAADGDMNYYVLTLDDPVCDVEVGNILDGAFDGSLNDMTVSNITRAETVHVILDDFEQTDTGAVRLLLQLAPKTKPSKIFTVHETLSTDMDDAAGNLLRKIRRP